MKKYFSIFVAVLLIFISGCVQNPVVHENELKLPNLNGKTREQIDYALKDLDLEYVYYIDNDEFNPNYDQFLRYGKGYQAGSIVEKGSFIRIYTTALNLTYTKSQDLKIDFDYENKSFIKDGVGKVTLIRPVDGDTAVFRDLTGDEIYLRFLGIDTPESTRGMLDPWGKEASNYCKNILRNAKEIVLESEGERKDNYDRYLGWVWVDGKLYNLMCLEEAYTNSNCNPQSKYISVFDDVENHVANTGRRFFGEVDPNYNYQK